MSKKINVSAAVLERYLRARILADSARSKVESIKLTMDFSSSCRIKRHCSFVLTELNSLIFKLDNALKKARFNFDEELSEEFELDKIVKKVK